MTNFRVLLRTFTVAKNPVAVLSLMRAQGERKKIEFRGGFALQLTWQQFRVMRDNYSLIRRFAIEQLEDNLFKLKNGKSEVTCAYHLVPLMVDIMQKYAIEQRERDLFKVKGADFELLGDCAMLRVLQEQDTGEYNADYGGKVVLDVGGYQGESAVFFHRKGAKKVIVYEPVAANHRFIQQNIALNHVNAEVHAEGIGDTDGTLNISFDNEADTSFGLPSKGEHIMQIKVRNVAQVIAESGADVAKFDCEGAEETLTRVSAETLRKIPAYIIEVHTPELKRLVVEKVEAAGFKLTKQIGKTPEISVIAFERANTSGK